MQAIETALNHLISPVTQVASINILKQFQPVGKMQK
jgi:hypothetical protein